MPALIGVLTSFFSFLLPVLGKIALAGLSWLILNLLFKMTGWFQRAYLWVMSFFQEDKSSQLNATTSEIPSLTSVIPAEWLEVLAMFRVDDSLSLMGTVIVYKITYNFTQNAFAKFNEVQNQLFIQGNP
jgi:hypothetical protein